MIFTETPLKGSYVIDLEPFTDERGWFVRTFCEEEFRKIGHNKDWLQLNHSYTKNRGMLRGMHYQLPPFSEIKLVRCIAGKIFDVIVDIRKNSSTFLQWFGVELSGENKKMIYIPEGFAHGFETLTNDCELIYHHTAVYKPGSESGLKYNDEILGIQWPIPVESMSERDKAHSYLKKDFKGV
ncbi:MAG: dTDP-4-dehydrorhamnose 3,5-epimerase [Ginsengibacter sp.]